MIMNIYIYIIFETPEERFEQIARARNEKKVISTSDLERMP